MTEVMLEIAENFFLANDAMAAYNMAKTALGLDPFYGNGVTLRRYVTAYRVHAAALRYKNPDGEMDWYRILGFNDDDYLVPVEDIHDLFCKAYKLIDPEDHCSAAAQEARKLLRKAFAIVGDMESRIAYHKRWNLPLGFRERPAVKKEASGGHLTSMSASQEEQRLAIMSKEISTAEPVRRRRQREEERSGRKIETSATKQQQTTTKKMQTPVCPMNTKATATTEPLRTQQQQQETSTTKISARRLNTKPTATTEPLRNQQQQQERSTTKISACRMDTKTIAPIRKEGCRALKSRSISKFKNVGCRRSTFLKSLSHFM